MQIRKTVLSLVILGLALAPANAAGAAQVTVRNPMAKPTAWMRRCSISRQ